MSSIAIAFGSCQASSSRSEAWIRSSRRSIGSSAGVSTTPPSRATMCVPSSRTIPNPRLAAPGSIPITTCMRRDSALRAGCLPGALPLDGDLLEQMLRDVEVGVDVVDVVVVVEVVEQGEERFRVALADLDRALRLHRHLGGLDLHPGGLERLADRAEDTRLAKDAEEVPVLADV